MGDFEIDTRLADCGAGRFRAVLSRDWEIWGPNGGYVAAIALRAAGRVARVQRPASISGHFVSVARFEPVDVTVRTVKSGRSAESFAVAITQDDRPIFEGLVRTAAEGPGLSHDVAEIPERASPAELATAEQLVGEGGGPKFPFWHNFDSKPVWPERFADGERPAYPPVFREWYRFRPRARFDDPFLDAARSLLMIDTASWIAACQPHPNAGFTAPNLDVTAWFHRAAPESEWLLMDHICETAGGGLMGTHAKIWSEDGQLVATGGAQLFCLPRAGDV